MNLKQQIQGFDVSACSAAVIGCGGLGTNVAVHLAGAGIGRLMLADFDVVEERNLNRQFFYTPADKGKEKSALLARRLKEYAPDCTVEYLTERVYEPAFASGYDIVILAVDNIGTRRCVNAFCRKNGFACVNGSVNGSFGTVYLYIPGQTPDLEAAGCLEEPSGPMLSPSPTVGVIGALEAKLAVDFLLGRTDGAGRLYIFDNNEIKSLRIKE